MNKNHLTTGMVTAGWLIVTMVMWPKTTKATAVNIINNVQVTADSQQIVNINQSVSTTKRQVEVEVDTDTSSQALESLRVELNGQTAVNSRTTTKSVSKPTTTQQGSSTAKVKTDIRVYSHNSLTNSPSRTDASPVVPRPLYLQPPKTASVPGRWPAMKVWMKKLWGNIYQLFSK